MPDVVIKFDELEHLIEKLVGMVDELDSGDRADAIEAAIGMPFLRSELTAAARDSESRWSSKRGNLVTELESIRDHAQEIRDWCLQFDDEAAAVFEGGTQTPATTGVPR